MIWIAPTEKDIDNAALEKRLWSAADQFRANSGLKSQEYSAPVLGLIFLRFAEVRFAAQRAKLLKQAETARPSRRSLGEGGRTDEPAAYHAEGTLFLPTEARFDYLLNRPEAENIGAKVNAAMRDIEKHNPQLAGVLPKTYNLFTSTLLKELLKKVSEIPGSLDYDDPHDATGRFDFVLANPPFNVNAVDKVRLKDMVGPARRFPFGLSRTDNANYLWIQLFHSALNEKGRAGLVMANSASDARASEQELRRQLIESRAVDVMVAVGPNMFYTVTLPCTLWFLDKGKSASPCKTPSPQPSPNARGGYRFAGLVERGRELRKKQTPAEAILWEVLRDRQFENLKFRRQHQAGDYLVDFLCHEYSLVVEADGDVHDAAHQIKHDKKRDAWLRGQGFKVLRFRNEDILNDLESVLRKIAATLPSPVGRRAGDEGASNVAYHDVPGLCKVATLKEIEAQGWSLNPGRYVGVAAGETVSDEDFKEQLETLNEELEALNASARELENTIATNVAEILEV